MAKTLRLVALFLTFCATNSFSQVVINEYSCSNRNIITDQDGDYEDYIELYNTTGATVDLTGWFLSDDVANPQKYTIPAGISIGANAFKLIWASSKNEVAGTNVHTNFKLTQTKFEKLLLSDPAGNLIDSLSLKLTQKNNARGRNPNGSSTWSVYTITSPGTSNGLGFTEYTERPTADIQQGFFSTAQTVTLSVSDPNATIYYTIDGSIPTTSSTVYTTPINISATTVLRARAFSSVTGMLGSFEEINTYFINVVHDDAFYVLSLSSNDFDNMFTSWGTFDIDAYMEFFDKQHVLQSEGAGKVDPHGNDSWAFPQKGIDFEMEDDYGYAHDIPFKIFEDRDRSSFDHLIFKAGASDNYPFSWGTAPAHLRDAYAHTMALRHNLDVDVRTYEPGVIYINGEYWGLYEVREKMDEPDFTNHYYSQEEDDIDICKFWGGLVVSYGSDTAWDNLYNFMQTNSMAVPANYAYVEARLNFTSMIDYMILNTYFVNCDWINWNTMWWRGRNPNGERTKWTYAFWDEDNILGLGQNYSGWPTTAATADPCDLQFTNAGPSMGHLEMLNWLLVNPDFKNLYVNRYADLMNTTISCDTMTALLTEFVDILTPEMPNQIARWGGSMTGWQNNVAYVEDFINDRCLLIDSGIVDCYDVTGPFDLTVLVSPAGSGEVHVSTLIPQSYPWYGTYFGGVDLSFKAMPFAGNNMQFAYWEVNNNIVNPNINVDSMFLNLQSDDVVIAHFENVLPAFGLTVDISPSNTGTITIEGTTPSVYPSSVSYLSGQTIDMIANAGTGYQFDYWELSNHFVNPNSTDPDVTFTLYTQDEIIAHFRPLTGIEDAHITSLNVYPTLTQDQFHIIYELTENVDLTIQIYSLTGQFVKDITNQDLNLKQQGKHQASISMKQDRLTPGVYFVNFNYPGFNRTFKVVLLPY